MNWQKVWQQGGLTDKEYLEIAYQAIQEARDIITHLYYGEDGFVRSDLKSEYRKMIGDIDYTLRGGFATKEYVEKYGLKRFRDGG